MEVVFLIVAFFTVLTIFGFVARYSRLRWERSSTGRNLMGTSVLLLIIFSTRSVEAVAGKSLWLLWAFIALVGISVTMHRITLLQNAIRNADNR